MKIDIERMKSIVMEAGKLFSDDIAAQSVTEKGASDFVTAVDFASQNYIKAELEKYFPEAALLSEEGDNETFEPKEYTFVLDPVDGTTNLIHRYRQSAVSLGLVHNGVSVAGVVYNPFTEELFWAEKGKGAYCNGRSMKVSPQADFSKCVITIGTMPYYKEFADRNFEMFKNIYLDAVDIRRTGSSALDLCYTADGRTEAFFERGLKAWDFAAGAVILSEAGGKLTDWEGNALDLYSQQDVVGSNGHVHDRMLSYLK